MVPSTHHQADRHSSRQRLLDAAISLIAREGLGNLSHRRVEKEAGLTHGATTYYFRTREAMISQVIEHLAERDQGTMDAVLRATHRTPTPAGAGADAFDRTVDGLAQVLEAFLTTAREQTVARFELFLHAARAPDLRDELTRGRAMFTSAAELFLAGFDGAGPDRDGTPDADPSPETDPDPDKSTDTGRDTSTAADTLVTGIDGVLFDGVCLPGPPAPDRLRRQAHALLAACTRAPASR